MVGWPSRCVRIAVATNVAGGLHTYLAASHKDFTGTWSDGAATISAVTKRGWPAKPNFGIP
eukprot:scaffold282069_cov38-Prasinocladus_malaysianus.AAC.1